MLTKHCCAAAILVMFLSCYGCKGGGSGSGDSPIPGKTIGGAGNDLAWNVSQITGTSVGYVIAGTTNSKGAGGYDAYVIKTDAMGSVTQEKTFGTTNNEFCFSVAQTADGGYIVTGFNGVDASSDPLNFELPRDYQGDLFLAKMDTNLITSWTTTVSGTATGNPSYGYASGYRAQQTLDDGYIVAGAIGNATGGGAAFILKTDQTGSIQWTASFDGLLATGVVEASGGGYVASATGISPPGRILKIDSSGGGVWNTPLNGSAEAVAKTSDGAYIVSGMTGSADVYLAKVDDAGAVLWETYFGSAGGDTGYAVQETADGGFIIAGRGSGGGGNHGFDAYLIKADPSGNVQWQKYFGGLGGDSSRSVRVTADGYVAAGYTNSKGAGGDDIYLIKSDSSGNAVW